MRISEMVTPRLAQDSAKAKLSRAVIGVVQGDMPEAEGAA